jgi:2-phosphosulfolactate phosphatase
VSRRVAIDCFPEAVARHADPTIVAVDVIRATTTAVTAAAHGHRVFVADTVERATDIAASHPGALLVGELGGMMPYGFDLQNSPALVDQLDARREIVLLSTSGTRLICDAATAGKDVLVGSLRNVSATARHLAALDTNVAVIGAGARGEFREEDQFGCVQIATQLIDAGFEPASPETAELVHRWQGAPADAFTSSHSVEYLVRTGQIADLDFIMSHLDDVDIAFSVVASEVTPAS